jgi:H+/Cl- antiporter ClcA
MFKLMGPQFLFADGDPNIRQNTGTGVLGYPIAALLTGFVVSRMFWKHRNNKTMPTTHQDSEQQRMLLNLAIIGTICGLMGAALTWESQPHSLRAVTAWPFVVTHLPHEKPELTFFLTPNR